MQYYYHVYCIHPGKYLAQSTVILLKTETLISFSYCWARLTKIILYCSICTIFLDCKEQTVETHTEHRRSNDPLEQIPYVVIVTFLPQIEKKKTCNDFLTTSNIILVPAKSTSKGPRGFKTFIFDIFIGFRHPTIGETILWLVSFRNAGIYYWLWGHCSFIVHYSP